MTNPTRHSSSVCGERFFGPLDGFPLYEKGFHTTRCKRQKPMGELMTVVFNFVGERGSFDGEERF
jgi:hypothetical protein